MGQLLQVLGAVMVIAVNLAVVVDVDAASGGTEVPDPPGTVRPPPAPAPAPPGFSEPDGAMFRPPLPSDALEWSWPPYAPVEGEPFPEDDDWAPASVVWHPAVRLGRWTVVYRRSA